MDYPTGIRPKAGGIEIRYQWAGRKYSEFISKNPTKTNIQWAARLRKDRIDKLRLGISLTDKADISFAAIAQQFLDAEMAHITREDYKRILNRFWMPFFGDLPIRAIQHDELITAVGKIQWTSARAKRNAIVPLRGVFNLALHSNLIEANPVIKLKSVKVQRPDIDPFTGAEKALILKGLKDRRALLFFTLAFEGGLRAPSELLGLHWADYDGRSLSVTKGVVRGRDTIVTKTKKMRRVLLTEKAIAALESEPVKSGPIFKNLDGSQCRDVEMIYREWTDALIQAGIRQRRPYNCRHTYASLGLMAGAKPAFLAKQLGHSLQIFFSTYARWIDSDDDKKELEKIETGNRLGKKRASN